MATTLKVIKATPFEHEGKKQTAYVTALRGSIINVSTFNFEADELTYDDKAKTLKVSGDVEVVVRPYTDLVTNKTANGLALLPALGLAINLVR